MNLPLIVDRPAHYLHWWTNRKGWFAHSSEELRYTNDGRHWLMLSVALVCPVCGELWGRMQCRPPPEYNRGIVRWRAVEHPCQEHGGGTFIDPDCGLPDPYVNLPDALIVYEAAIALEQYLVEWIPVNLANEYTRFRASFSEDGGKTWKSIPLTAEKKHASL